MDQIPAEAMIMGLRRVQLVTSFDLVAVAMYTYEYFVTLDMEVSLVWSTDWNWMKFIFLLQRYMPFFDTAFLIMYLKFGPGMTIHLCKDFYTASAYMMTSGTAISELILTLRAWAVWNRDTRLTFLLPTLYCACFAPMLFFMYKFTTSLIFIELPGPLKEIQGTQCFVVDADRILFMVWVMLMIYHAIILLLMVIPGWKAYRAGGDSDLYQTVYRDGLFYYVFLFALSTVNIIVIKMLPHGYENLLTGVERCMHSIITSRVLLHIRQLGNKNNDEQYTVHHWSDAVTQLPAAPKQEVDSSIEFDSVHSHSHSAYPHTVIIRTHQVVSEAVI
ncbi:hypothetical protein BJ165DRAFT_918048 [Panaeolus papilionaceus]|nr:hypothetical protein BJ165DRAFT_918048 [Panaeolus papilionaceus]